MKSPVGVTYMKKKEPKSPDNPEPKSKKLFFATKIKNPFNFSDL